MYRSRFQPLLKERKIFFSTIKALTQVRKAQASRGFWWYGPPWNHEILQILVSLKWHFLHFHIIFVVFYSILGLYYYHKNLWSFLCCCISSVQKQGDFFYCIYTMATLKNHYKVNIGVRQMQTADLQTGRETRKTLMWNALTDSLSLKFKSFKSLV